MTTVAPPRCVLQNTALMTTLLRTELPYRENSATLFEAVADLPWAVFLDSGRHVPGQSRYDIIAAEPFVRLVTRGNLTEVRHHQRSHVDQRRRGREGRHGALSDA